MSAGRLPKLLAAVLLVLLCIALALCMRASVVAGGGETDVSDVTSNDNLWWARPIEPEARGVLQRYAKRVISPALNRRDRGPFAKKLRAITNSPRIRKEDLLELKKYLARSRLANTAAGLGAGKRAARRAQRVAAMFPEGAPAPPLLDIGCGDGSVSAALAASGVTCVEPGQKPKNFPEEVRWAQEAPDGTLPFPDGEFASATALMSLHHVDPDTLPHLAKEIGRVTRPGGVLVIREHDMENCGLPEKAAKQYIDWVHIIFDLAEGEDLADLQQSHYRAPKEWDALFAEDFALIDRQGHDLSACAYFASYKRRE